MFVAWTQTHAQEPVVETLSMAAEVRLRVGQWHKFCKMSHWLTENQQARALGVSPSTVNRILKGTQRPSGEFIGAVLTAFPHLEFSDLFEVVEKPANADEPVSA